MMHHLALLFAGCLPLLAQAGIYTHVDPKTGMTIISNVEQPRAPALTPVAAAPGQSAPVTGAAQSARQAAPADFPRISAERQRAFDGDRRAILLAELASEQAALGAALAARAAGDVTHRHQNNISSLQRELRALR